MIIICVTKKKFEKFLTSIKVLGVIRERKDKINDKKKKKGWAPFILLINLKIK